MKRSDFLLLAAAALLLLFANGERVFAAAVWLGAPLLVRFLRTQPLRRGALLGYLALLPVWIVQWPEVFRFPVAMLVPVALVLNALVLLPFVADRWLAPRFRGFAQTLVLPIAMLATEWFLMTFGSFGAWGSLAYSQAGFTPLLRTASLFGMWGILFLIGWWAATVNHANRRSAAIFATVAIALLAWGAWHQVDGPSRVRVATVAIQPKGKENYDVAAAPALRSRLFAASEDAARRGARLIAWAEDSFFIAKADEPALLAEAAAFARRHRVHLAIAYATRMAPPALRYENHTALLAPDGTLAWNYRKAFATPGYEEKYMIRGERRAALATTAIGRLASVICFDADHLDVLRPLRGRADILIVPSDDWREITDLHARMLRFRAVELGVPVLRPTINGRSMIVGPSGEVLASSEWTDSVLVADVPVASGS